jgi:ornithine cyclodeaminase/alanine dehydrogenase-like protein (mu-crystallin family)
MSFSAVPGIYMQFPRVSTTGGSLPVEPSGLKREMAILRLPSEPCIYYPEMTVHREIMSGLCGFMDALESFYRAWACGEAAVTQPPKQVYWRPDVRGDWRVMPCAVERGWPGSEGATSGIDAVKIIGTNEEERVVRDKISVGKALLLHPTDHHVEAIFDVAALSSFRTAAISVLAYKYGGHRHDDVAGIVGAGRIGYYTASILRQWMGLSRLLVHDAADARMHAFTETVGACFGGAVHGAGRAELCRDSQAVFLATSSSQPLVDGRRGRDARFISSVGADADNLSELAPDVLDGRVLVSESRQNIAFGDLHRWHAAGLIGPEHIRTLDAVIGDAVAGVPVDRGVVFISTGTAVQDALVCRFLHDRLAGRGGQPLGAPPPGR